MNLPYYTYQHCSYDLVSSQCLRFDFINHDLPLWFPIDGSKRTCCHNHIHSQIEILYVTEGSVSFYIGDTLHELHAGDCLFVNPMEPHYGYIPDSCDLVTYYVQQMEPEALMKIPSAEFQKDMDKLVNQNYKYPNRFGTEQSKQFGDIILKTYYDLSDQSPELQAIADVANLFVLIGVPQPYDPALEPPPKDQFIHDTLVYIQSASPEELNLSAISQKFSYSKSYFSSLFKKKFSISFTEFCIQRKIEHIKYRIVRGDRNLNELCTKEGFNHYAYFYRKFKEITGIAPAEYIKWIERKR